MKKKLVIVWAVLVLPSIIYFVVNGYWWLFDGNHPMADKMVASLVVSFLGSITIGLIYSEAKS